MYVCMKKQDWGNVPQLAWACDGGTKTHTRVVIVVQQSITTVDAAASSACFDVLELRFEYGKVD